MRCEGKGADGGKADERLRDDCVCYFENMNDCVCVCVTQFTYCEIVMAVLKNLEK